MNPLNITGKQVRYLGYPQGPVVKMAMHAINTHYAQTALTDALALLTDVLAQPEAYLQHPHLHGVAAALWHLSHPPAPSMVALNPEAIAFSVFGQALIEPGAMQQMEQAARLPISVAAALMPDAHSGYGLPIGGVLATTNAVIPYGVGVDIGCRMCLSLFAINPTQLAQKTQQFARHLHDATRFGAGALWQTPAEHAVLDHDLFNQLPLLKSLQRRAQQQLGTSGSGNHFAEFGRVTIIQKDDVLGVEPGLYVGFLTHSGSRALGANIADHYTKLAMQMRQLPTPAQHLAWLSMNEAEGQEYWLAMNLAGDYASACHHVIHQKIATQLGERPVRMVENHHNFAWKEMVNGTECIVHRKGATPAGKNVLGIIPGSMTANGYIVKGRGYAEALNSAAHGAGRQMSRTKALANITKQQLRQHLEQCGVTLLAGGLDEAPFAYKDINTVMQSQTSLIDVVGTFTPKIVLMDRAETRLHRRTKHRTPEGE
ncbi:MAG: RtcB family protein [Bacteroidetes bacterium]|nr:MAG: RtcB family protein [Bacteroidota bacterium]